MIGEIHMHWYMRFTIVLMLFTSVVLGSTPSYPIQPVPFTDVKVQGGFWGPRFETNRKVTVWYDFEKCEETERIANFARAGGLEDGEFVGIPFNDSDVVKVIEGAAYLLAQHPDPKLDKYVDGVIAKIAAAQEDDGYLFTARTLREKGRANSLSGGRLGMVGDRRWENVAHGHELYNVGHMYEAAVAHYLATGKRTFLDVAIKNANLICKTFGPGPGQIVDVPGHEEIEIGLVRLYGVTGDRKYLDQAKFFIDMRGRADKRKQIYGTYAQDHKPLVDQTEAVGHAVRGGYLYAGVADVAALTGDKDYIAAIDRIWEDVIQRKLYLIGSVGQHGAGEGYAGAYKLDNLKAYNETCAAIALALWNQRMFLLHGDAKYVDVLERILYNGFLAGVSLSGDRFFYPNPLTCDMKFKFNHGALERSPWFGCSCCPVNVVRFIPSIAGYVYAVKDRSLYVNLYINSDSQVTLNESEVKIRQETHYPWQGRIKLTITPMQTQTFTLKLRIPGWAQGQPVPSDLYRYENAKPAKWSVHVNGRQTVCTIKNGYAEIERFWRAGDTIILTLPMRVRRVVSHEKVTPNRGRLALERGPIVYCMEGADHDGKVLDIFVPDKTRFTAEHREDLLGGVTVLEGKGQRATREAMGKLISEDVPLTLIPYYAWCHRGANEMAVWLPRSAAQTDVPTAPLLGTEIDRKQRNQHYVSNRAPLLPSALIKLHIGSITPRGWLGKQLRLQADGFHGHLTEISQFLKKEDNAWLSPIGEGKRGWEEVPYWLKGFSNCAYVLGDQDMIAEARIWIEGALNSQKPDGWFGPDKGRGGAATRLKGRADLWPNAIMLFCLQDYYDYSGDERVIELMTHYFRYLSKVPEDQFLLGYWPKMRGADLLFSVHWLYNRTGDKWLLPLAEKVHRRTARWDEGLINWHNVNICQAFGGPATYYCQSHDVADLNAADRNFREIRRLYGQVPGGLFGADENCREGYTGPRQAVETCGMVEFMLSCETLLWISGAVTWADRCEDVAFNSLPAALTADLKALRYLTAPNHVQSDRKSKSPGIQNGGPMYHMNPNIHRCCQHNWGHGWPYYAQNLWMATPDNGLAAVFYCANRVKAKVGQGAGTTEVTIDEVTHYPFDEEIELNLSMDKSATFPLYLRIPGWCDKPIVKVNDRRIESKSQAGRFVRLSRRWRAGDKVHLTLSMETCLRRWPRNRISVSVERGPLTYSLKIGERKERQGGSEEWPAWEIYPTTPWNYGLILGEKMELVQTPWPEDDMPFTHSGCPLALKAKGKRIPQWSLDYLGLCTEIQESPVKSNEPMEDITLIPMGAARLRVSAFPVIGEGPDAHIWQEAPQPFYRVSASHCHSNDTLTAACDGVKPRNSNDHSIARFTWWDHRGSKEWLSYTFEEPKRVSRVRVYWFDDTGTGHCRVPASWCLLYRVGREWKPVENPSVYGVDRDRFNVLSFDPVTTVGLRMEVQLRAGFSGGILEWTIE